jgi:hypothetical protein
MADADDRTVRASADGMFDVVDWTRRIKGHVVEPGADPRLLGYSAEGDLARHYGFTEVLFLTLAGELPDEQTARALDVVMAFLAVVPSSEGPTHAASLVRLCNGPGRAVLQVGAVALAERARFVLDEHRAFLSWLDGGGDELPVGSMSTDPTEASSVARLRDALPPSLAVPVLARPLTRSAALIAVLHACGLRRAEQIELVWTMAGLGAVFAEAMATKPFAFRDYPMGTPAFRYTEES